MVIEDYSFGSIRIDGNDYRTDVILYPDGIAEWTREEGHYMQVSDAGPLLSRNPDILLVGTGSHGGMRVSTELGKSCEEKGVELIVGPTTEIWKTYNRLVGPGSKKVIAAMHLTC